MSKISKRYVDAVAAHLATRLHTPRSGFRCRCGQCRHAVLTAARRSGIPARVLVQALPPEGKPKEREKRGRRPLTSQVANTMHVVRGGQRQEGVAAVLALLGDTEVDRQVPPSDFPSPTPGR